MSLSRFVLFALGATSTHFALAQNAVVPMYNYQFPAGVKSLGQKIYPGVSIDVVGGELQVNPSQTLFFEPAMASVLATGFSRSIGANCPAVRSAISSEAQLGELRNKIITLLNSSSVELERTLLENAKSAGLCAAGEIKTAAAQDIVDKSAADLTRAADELQNAQTALETCKLLNRSTPEACASQEKTVIEISLDVIRLKDVFIKSRNDYSAAKREETQVCSDARRTLTQISKLLENTASLTKALADISVGVNSDIVGFGNAYGGSAAAVISNQAADQANRLAAANPGFDVRPVEIKAVQFQFLSEITDYDKSIQRRTVLGVAVQGANGTTDTLKGSIGAEVASGSGSTAVQISLSRIGACSADLTRSAGFRYAYDGYGFVRGSVTYNKWQAYEKFEQTTQNGGLFTSKSVHELDEQMKGGQTFKFAFASTGKEDGEKMKTQLRAALASELATNWAEVTSLDTNASMAVPGASQHGAQVVADGIVKVCPHIYCVAGSMVLKSFDAIFGKNISRDEVKRQWDAIVTDDFAYTRRYALNGISATTVRWDFPPAND